MQKTPIEYLDMTWNPIAMRCTPVSAGCDNCWHLRMANRLSAVYDGPFGYTKKAEAYAGGSPFFKTDELAAPLRRKKPAVIGVEFMGDLFHESIPYEWIAAVYGVMAACPQHTFVILTKRAERRWEWYRWMDSVDKLWTMCTELDGVWLPQDKPPWPLPNVIEGVSVEDQPTADVRVPWLLRTPAAKRVVSYEPALGPVDYGPDYISETGTVWAPLGEERSINCEGCQATAATSNHPGGRPYCPGHDAGGIDGIIMGAETGPGARPMDLQWARDVRDQCQAAGVPFFFKRDSRGNFNIDGYRYEEVPW